jgi:cardiolipin synthase (CMP-forming)
MIRVKTLADTLTVSRVFLAFVILWLGMAGGSEALPAATAVLIVAWATDLLDGAVARCDRSAEQTWVGRHDLHADMSVGLGVLGYLTIAGFVHVWAGIGYLLVCAVLLWMTRSDAVGMAVQAPPYGLMLYQALRHAPLQGGMAIAYLALIVIITWPRFPRQTVPGFLRGMRDLGSKNDDTG